MSTSIHLVNQISILQPRWHDMVILPRVDKFKPGHNVITIEHHNYPNKYYMNYLTAHQYPTEVKHSRRGDYLVYVIPVKDLVTVAERNEIVRTSKEIFS